jgi:hypothetical protein
VRCKASGGLYLTQVQAPMPTSSNKSELKIQELVVGAWRFELQASCNQNDRLRIERKWKRPVH